MSPREESWMPRAYPPEFRRRAVTLGIDYEPETDDETGDQLDFMFALQPSPPSPIDEVLVVEIKRGTHPDGKERRVSDLELDKFYGYVLAADEAASKSTVRPRVTGMMIASGYTRQADVKRRNLETLASPRFIFRTWARVSEDTERLHTGWLALASQRAGPPPPVPVEEAAAET